MIAQSFQMHELFTTVLAKQMADKSLVYLHVNGEKRGVAKGLRALLAAEGGDIGCILRTEAGRLCILRGCNVKWWQQIEAGMYLWCCI